MPNSFSVFSPHLNMHIPVLHPHQKKVKNSRNVFLKVISFVIVMAFSFILEVKFPLQLWVSLVLGIGFLFTRFSVHTEIFVFWRNYHHSIILVVTTGISIAVLVPSSNYMKLITNFITNLTNGTKSSMYFQCFKYWDDSDHMEVRIPKLYPIVYENN